jgi:hypothetical protein
MLQLIYPKVSDEMEKKFYNIGPRSDTNLVELQNSGRLTGREYIIRVSQFFWWDPTWRNWDFIKSIFTAGFAGQRDLDKDPTAWLDGARPPPLVLLVLHENEFAEVII